MIGMRSLTALAAVVNVIYGSAIVVPEEEWHLTLLKRQAPGTPLYACHMACGTAITLSKGASPCTNEAFLTDYADCLVCAGPSDLNIWRYYGATLTTAGTACGLSTTPGAAPPAVSVSSSAETASSTAPATTTSVVVSPPTVSSTTSSSVVSETPSVTSYPTGSITSASWSTTVAPTYTPSSTVVATSSAGNTTTSTIAFTGAANSAGAHMAGAFAIAAGAVFAAVL